MTDEKDGTVRLSGSLICVSEEEAETVRRHLPEHMRLTLAEPGCVSFLVVETEDPRVWAVEERFVDEAAFAAHQRRAGASEWGIATAGIRRDYRMSTAPADGTGTD